jgi:GTP-binding protein EngB required for normal cell division
MKMIHQIFYPDIRKFRKAIEDDEYEFYDEYMDCKEVLIAGSSNSGKSSLINVLNGGTLSTRVAKMSKRSGKTQSLNFYHCKQSPVSTPTKRREQGFIVDSPGYGYTYAPVKVKN